MGISGFPKAGNSGEQGNSNSYKGEIDLTPRPNYVDAVANVFTECTYSNGNDGVFIITPNSVMTNNGGIAGFSVSATGLLCDYAISETSGMSFIWPDLSVNEIGYFMLAIHDENTTATDMFIKQLVDHNRNAYASVVFIAHNGAGMLLSSQNSYSGTNSATNTQNFTQPTAGTKVYLKLNQVTGAIQLSDYNDNVGSGSNYDVDLAPFPLSDLPVGNTVTISLIYAVQGNVTTLLQPLVVDFGDGTGAVPSFKQIGSGNAEIQFPSGTQDGDIFKCTGAGDFAGKTIRVNDFFTLIENKTDCIVTPCKETIQAIAYSAAEDVMNPK